MPSPLSHHSSLSRLCLQKPLAVILPRNTAEPGPILDVDSAIPASHPAQGPVLVQPPALHRASQQCWEWELGTSHNITGGDMGDENGGRSVSCLVSLNSTGNSSQNNCPQSPFLAWKYPSFLHPIFPQSHYFCLCDSMSRHGSWMQPEPWTRQGLF